MVILAMQFPTLLSVTKLLVMSLLLLPTAAATDITGMHGAAIELQQNSNLLHDDTATLLYDPQGLKPHKQLCFRAESPMCQNTTPLDQVSVPLLCKVYAFEKMLMLHVLMQEG